jgi:hypothetical protein
VRVELPSGCWVEIRDKLMAGDKFAVQGSFNVKVIDGEQVMPGSITNLMRNALLTETITAWGGPGLEGIPVPSANLGGADIIGTHLDIDDYNCLVDAVEPMLEKVTFTGPKKKAATGNSTTPSSSS